MRQMNPGHDPAPSRWSYRVQRWMLTPGIRTGLRVGVPIFLVVALIAGFLADQGRRDALALFVSDIQASIQERPEFMVKIMAIDGAGKDLADDIREVLPIDFPVSSFDLDLPHIRGVVTGLDPVRTATVRIRPGGVLQVNVIERDPVLIWRDRQGLSLLDETGAHVTTIVARGERADLPVIAGDGADTAVDEALALFSAAEPLGERVRGLVRVGERRWDLVLDRNQRILLPTEHPVDALDRVLALNAAQDMLDRDLAVVDMRLGTRPTLRLTHDAVQDWRRIRGINVNGQ